MVINMSNQLPRCLVILGSWCGGRRIGNEGPMPMVVAASFILFTSSHVSQITKPALDGPQGLT